MANKILELYYENDAEYIIYEDIIVPPTIEIFVCDHTYKKIVLPDELRVIDLHYPDAIPVDFNIPSHIQYMKFENISIVNKSLMELFPEYVYYYYKDCSLNGRPIVDQVRELYQKYFNAPCLKGNIINHRNNKQIIDHIRKYEENTKEAKIRSNILKKELLEIALHPTRVAKWFAAGFHPRNM